MGEPAGSRNSSNKASQPGQGMSSQATASIFHLLLHSPCIECMDITGAIGLMCLCSTALKLR